MQDSAIDNNAADVALRSLLADIAERTRNPGKRQFVLHYLRTMNPLAERSESELDVLSRICDHGVSLARMNRELSVIISSPR
ncbi:hypothetical protein OG976_22960 [Mycobacterium sp. NBC_00419]|uniref:hypothetical protein n=1 Tax=Mycobacterium sp. NBC_00419 TaxID=2975989 RepID=UPI002E1A165B